MLINPSPESSECPTEEETLLHVEAANITNFLTKAQTRHYVKSIAHVLRSRFNIGGLGAGKDVVICISSGQILLPSLFYATIAAGGVYSSASNTVTDQELTRQINHGKATLLVASPDCEELARMAARASNLSPDRILILDSYNGKRSLLDHAQHDLLDPSGKDDRILLDWEVVTDANTLRDRPICLIYSSGTTGQPKGEFKGSSPAEDSTRESRKLIQITSRRLHLSHQSGLIRPDSRLRSS